MKPDLIHPSTHRITAPPYNLQDLDDICIENMNDTWYEDIGDFGKVDNRCDVGIDKFTEVLGRAYLKHLHRTVSAEFPSANCAFNRDAILEKRMKLSEHKSVMGQLPMTQPRPNCTSIAAFH